MNDQSGMPGYAPINSQEMDSDPFDFVVTQPLRQVSGSVDDNPDDAARAVDLSKSTGVPAPVIATDLDGFEQLHKQSLANQIIRSNPTLIDYVRSHPMAASVSNDDWANLADVASTSNRLEKLLALDPARGAMEGAVAGFGEGLVTKPAMQQSIDDWYADKPLAWAIMSAAMFPATELIRGFNALMGAQFGAIRGGAETAYKAVTGDAEAAKDFGEDAVQNAGVILAGSMADVSEPSAMVGHLERQREAYQAAKPWLEAGIVPPRGVHPLIDQSLADINAEGVQRLNEIVSASQKSATRERSYEMFHNFITQMHGDATIGIHGPAVAELYGDKVPEPGDGLLGFAPHIGDQLLAANVSGLDVHIPIKDWLSQVDPAVATQLHDDIRIFPGGTTAREAKEPFDPKPMVDAPIAQVRGTSGLEPRFALGDRKLTLEPDLSFKDFEAFKREFGLDTNISTQEDFEKNESIKGLAVQDRYWFKDSVGNRVGELRLTPDPEVKELYVDWIGGIGPGGRLVADIPNTLGPASVRDLLRQLKSIYPGWTLTGERVTGARERAGVVGQLPQPSVRLDLNDIPESGVIASPESLQQVDSAWRQLGPNVYARLSDAVDTTIHQELRRLVGKFPTLVPADEIYYGRAQPQGLMQPKLDHPPIIAWNALNPNAIGIARHEAIHYLRGYGFFTPEEWAELGWHALQEGWLDKYHIRERYPHLGIEAQIEEAIAEGYRDWASGREPVVEPTGLVAKAFQKMKDLWEAIRDKLRSVFGGDVDVEGLLQTIHEGRMARRRPQTKPVIEGVSEPKFIQESMTAYHGTDRDFEAFDPTFTRGGNPAEEGANFFSKTPEGANAYAHGTGANVRKVRIDLTNHKVYDPQELLNNPATREGFLADLKESFIKETTRNDYLKSRYATESGRRYVEDLWEGRKEKFLEDAKEGRGISFQQTMGALITRARREGVESATIKNLMESHGHDQVMVLNPNRITSFFEPKLSISEEDFRNLKANALGLDATSYKRLQEAIKARYESDLTAAVERAERQQKQEQTAEWKRNLPDVRKEVEQSIRQRPDVAADLFVNSGEFEGQKLGQRVPLRADDLSDEQKAALPLSYYAKNGLPMADVARLFGYQDGQHLVERLSVMAAQRGERTPQEHIRDLINDETQLRMERKYGRLEDNIMEAASDQALSDTDINLLVDEYHAAGMLAKQPTIDKNTIKAQVQSDFSKLPVGSVSSQRLLAEVARHDRDVNRALIPGQVDEVAALKGMERKVYTAMMAAEARKVEKEIARFDKAARKLSKREVGGLPQTYLNFIHQILTQVGKPISRSPLDLKTEIAEHGTEHSLEEFVAGLENAGQETEVWPQLFDQDWGKPYKELTVDEFRNVKDSVDSLNFIGRNVKKITKAGEKADLDDIKQSLIDSLTSFGLKHYDEEHRGLGLLPPGIYLDLPRTFLANSLTLETIFGRWDHFDPFGAWTQWGLRGLIDANGEEHTMRRDIAGKLTEIYESDKSDKSMKDPVYNPLFRDTIGGGLRKFDRSNLRAVMLNTGSRGGRRSNLTYLAKGHGLEEEHILNWINDHATKEDWDWCQKIWDLFRDELWEPAQQMRRNLNGIGAKSLEVPPIQTPFGEYAGGYYPVIFSEVGKQTKKSLEEGLFGRDYTRATTWEGYAKERTGAYAPLRLDLEPMAARIGQIIHDIKMRPAVLNAAKLFYDSDIRMAISRYYGKEFADLLEPYLRDVAGTAKYQSKAVEFFDRVTDTIQKNMVVSLIGVNPGTIAKHGLTAGVLSLNEVGLKDFAHAVRSLFSVNDRTSESNYQMIMRKLDELQNRSRTWTQTLTGAADEFVPGGSMRSFKQKVAEWSARPIAIGDMFSSIPTGLAAYQRAIKDGRSEGDAVFLANRAVRRAHGSASITNRSGGQRDWPKAITTFYTFFNDMLNRRAEVVWRAADALGVTGDHTWAQARAELRPIAAGLFSTVLFTAFVEQMVSPIHFKQDDSIAKKAALALGKDQAAGLVVARDVANWFIEGRDPSLGLYSTAFHEFGDAIRDTAKAVTQKQHVSKEQAGKIIQDSAAFVGIMTGMIPLEVGKAGRFVYGTHVGTERPQGPWGWATGLRYGTLENHSPTFERWRTGR